MTWETVIGLEVHAQLKTSSKLFSGSATTYGASANAQTNFIDAGLPGTLPVLNERAVQMAIQFGLATNAKINNLSFFERKNYFYPDLPKGYQISQFQRPILSEGQLKISINSDEDKVITIERAHLEEDAGKSLHESHPFYTGIDLNRAGTPLLEIVTTPCLSSAEEAVNYLKNLRQLLLFLDICDGNMQEGSFRCDVNISLKPKDQNMLGIRTEIKNLNSFRFIEKAIKYEQKRHQRQLEQGHTLEQETRLYCPETDTTQVMRSKESENDYRYFPDPDLLPIYISDNDLEQIKKTMPPLPNEIKQQLIGEQSLTIEDINFLLSSPATFQFFEAVKISSKADKKLITNWLKGNYAAALKEKGVTFETSLIAPEQLGALLDHLVDKSISSKIAKNIFEKLLASSKSVDEIIKEEGYQQVNDSSVLEEMVRNTIEQFPQQAEEYRNGKQKLLAFFVGQLMKQTKGQADPEQINQLLKKYLR